MFNNKYGDEGFTILFNKEIYKSSEELDFLGELKEIQAYIRLFVSFINPFTYYFINDSLTDILKSLNNIEIDYSKNIDDNYKVKSVINLENKIEEIKIKVGNYKSKEIVSNKISALAEVIYCKFMKLERLYYKLKINKKYQSYLNRVSDYFYLLKDFINKEM